MKAGAARIDITPTRPIEMEGMLRAHPSEGVHDPIFACALVMASDADLKDSCAIISVDVCMLGRQQASAARNAIAAAVGIPAERIIIAAKHIHSGPVTWGAGEVEVKYSRVLVDKLVQVAREAADEIRPVRAGVASGREGTISYYRRLLADDGHVVMNWEPYPPDHIVGPLGEVDPEVGVLKLEDMSGQCVCLLFNHAGHPNVLSGDNYLISAEYTGLAERLLEAEFGGTAIFVNGAQGTMDVDGLGPRDWAEMERIGRKLADVVVETARRIEPVADLQLRCANSKYGLPARKISDEQLAWAEEIIKQTGGKVEPLADGVGDDYLAVLYKGMRDVQDNDIPVEQVCIAMGDTAWISFPGELYTEIGVQIKAASPFNRTFIVGLANDYIGYVPTRKANAEGGYAEQVRSVEADAEEHVRAASLTLLNKVYHS